MNDLLKLAIEAHGGLVKWQALQRVEAELRIGGALWTFTGQAGLFADARYVAPLHAQRGILFDGLGSERQRSIFAPERVRLETAGGTLLEERAAPRDSFGGTGPWDRIHAAYFSSYAMWNYLTQPFLYALPGFNVEELAPWEEQGETWRRLKIVYPGDVVGHTREQVSYFGPDGLLRRHDYSVDVLGGATGANYAFAYREVNGIMVPMQRRVFGRQADGRMTAEPLLVSIDIARIAFD
jgi:hypothetical protein